MSSVELDGLQYERRDTVTQESDQSRGMSPSARAASREFRVDAHDPTSALQMRLNDSIDTDLAEQMKPECRAHCRQLFLPDSVVVESALKSEMALFSLRSRREGSLGSRIWTNGVDIIEGKYWFVDVDRCVMEWMEDIQRARVQDRSFSSFKTDLVGRRNVGALHED
jgi:hypothetical protein